jgi:CDGSH-type Zn-finger protein
MSETDQAAGGEGEGPSKWAQPGCVTLRCREDGPLVVELPAGSGDATPGFRVIDHLGGEFELPVGKRAVALCRCGRSARKPFCDGSHRAAGFRASESAGGS